MSKPKYQYILMPWNDGKEVLNNLKNQKFTSFHDVVNALVAAGFKVESGSSMFAGNITIACFQLNNGKVVAYPSIYLKVSNQ